MKKQFILIMQRMADNQSIFQAGEKFWAGVYEKLDAGITAGIDSTFITVYKTLKTLDAVENDKTIQRQAQFDQEQRILLSAIDKRIAGSNVYLICASRTEAAMAEQAFFKLVDILTPVLKQRGFHADLLAKGAIRFMDIGRAEREGFSWTSLRIPGIGPHDLMYLMPSVIHRHYAPFIDAYKRHSQDLQLSDFVQGLKATVEQHFRNSQANSPVYEIQSYEWDYK